MARTSGQTDGEARRTPSAPTSASSGFTQSYSVVEKASSYGSNGSGSSSSSTVNGHEDTSSASTSASTSTGTASRFKSNSATMAQRAVQDTRDTLLWVTRFGESAVDRVALRDAACTMKQNQYRDILTERWVNGCCSYPPCSNAPRRAYSEDPVYRINLRSRKVLDTSAASKFCSEECTRRSAWYESVCLSSDSFQAMSQNSSAIQLLEDIEGTAAQQPRDGEHAAAASTTPATADPAHPPEIHVQLQQDAYASMADDFLSRLQIIERAEPLAPAPPSLSVSHLSPEDTPVAPASSSTTAGASRHAQAGPGGALLPFDMSSVQRELVASQQTPNAQRQLRRAADDQGEPLAQRGVEIEVDPQNRQTLDDAWEMFNAMRDSWEMT